MYTKWLLVLCFVYFSLNISCAQDLGDPLIDNTKQPTEIKSESITKKSNKVTTVKVSSSTTAAPKPAVTVDNVTKCAKNDSNCQEYGGIWKKIQDNKGMLLRTLYVLIGITSIVIIYFVLRAWRLRRRRSYC
ncbi:hypothetical protein KUTeg_017510 [Tegillarca granosa]|uniref:Uncharacterized protein n=1 Tax=Tegillarca granosa TaxID=220873 RepID=A0ABQ9EK17_TEGGR|nr:hypothetical protein KUTeg_017510 [Tegillarca granosa]